MQLLSLYWSLFLALSFCQLMCRNAVPVVNRDNQFCVICHFIAGCIWCTDHCVGYLWNWYQIIYNSSDTATYATNVGLEPWPLFFSFASHCLVLSFCGCSMDSDTGKTFRITGKYSFRRRQAVKVGRSLWVQRLNKWFTAECGDSIGWQWPNFVPYLCQLIFAAIL